MQILTRINWVDILVVILMVRISYVAFRDGLSHEIFPLFGSIFVLIFSLYYYPKLGFFLSQGVMNIPVEAANCISFIILVVALAFIVKFIKTILDKIVKVEWHPLIEKMGGLIAGIAKAYIITALILMILALIPLSYLQWSIREKSVTGRYVLMAGPEIFAKVSGFLPVVKVGEKTETAEQLMKNLLSDKSVAPKAPAKKQYS